VAVYFVETSALAKRYIAETGSVWLRALLGPSTGCSIYVVRVTAVEIIAAITRRERGGTLTPTDAAAARQAFRSDLATAYQVIEVTPRPAGCRTRLSLGAHPGASARTGHSPCDIDLGLSSFRLANDVQAPPEEFFNHDHGDGLFVGRNHGGVGHIRGVAQEHLRQHVSVKGLHVCGSVSRVR
jgi:hypothetical protein